MVTREGYTYLTADGSREHPVAPRLVLLVLADKGSNTAGGLEELMGELGLAVLIVLEQLVVL